MHWHFKDWFYSINNLICFSLTESGATEGLSKVTSRTPSSKTIIEATEEEKDNLISKRESSHEYD